MTAAQKTEARNAGNNYAMVLVGDSRYFRVRRVVWRMVNNYADVLRSKQPRGTGATGRTPKTCERNRRFFGKVKTKQLTFYIGGRNIL
ncbi:MAG: hypothetical protein R3E63_09590 [Pseudomonadales bacterium]